MPPSSLTKRFTPAWPALLLLGPVVVLAAVGLFSLRQDRLLVEQEARSQAEILAATVARELQAELQNEIEDYLRAAQDRQLRFAEAGTRVPPGAPDVPARAKALTAMDRWQQAHPTIRLTDMPQAFCRLEGDRWVDPPAYPEIPAPPAWWASASPALVTRWQEARTAMQANEAGQAAPLLSEFSTNPVVEWAALARFHRILLADLPADERAHALLTVAQENPTQLTESGMPLADLALFLAIKAASTGGTLAELSGVAARRLRLFPTMYSASLLDGLEARARTLEPSLLGPVLEWRSLAQAAEQAREILRQLAGPGRPVPGLRKLALESGAYYAFVTRLADGLAPGDAVAPSSMGGTMVTIIPVPLVEEAISRVRSRLEPAWPPYLGMSAVVGRHPLGNPEPGLAVPEGGGTERAERTQETLPAAGRFSGEPPALLAGRQAEVAIGELALPLTVSVVLADRALLFARQRQRTWMFGGLVLAAAAVATLGAWLMQRNLARQLRLNEAKSNFVSSVSHELRAPIASVRLLAEGLERGRVPEPARQQEYFRFIVQECRRLSALVENVLDVSRIEQGRKQYEFDPLDLGALVEATVKLMQPYAAEQGCELRLAFEEANTTAGGGGFLGVGDGKALQQALVNLIDNAMKHSPKGGTVIVGIERHRQLPLGASSSGSYRSYRTHSSLALFVEDQGPGIPAAEHERIFERFYRCGSELRRETPGVGIGLSIVKHVAEAHGGRVLVRSAPGAGSRFTIELPWNES